MEILTKIEFVEQLNFKPIPSWIKKDLKGYTNVKNKWANIALEKQPDRIGSIYDEYLDDMLKQIRSPNQITVILDYKNQNNFTRANNKG